MLQQFVPIRPMTDTSNDAASAGVRLKARSFHVTWWKFTLVQLHSHTKCTAGYGDGFSVAEVCEMLVLLPVHQQGNSSCTDSVAPSKNLVVMCLKNTKLYARSVRREVLFDLFVSNTTPRICVPFVTRLLWLISYPSCSQDVQCEYRKSGEIDFLSFVMYLVMFTTQAIRDQNVEGSITLNLALFLHLRGPQKFESLETCFQN